MTAGGQAWLNKWSDAVRDAVSLATGTGILIAIIVAPTGVTLPLIVTQIVTLIPTPALFLPLPLNLMYT